MVSLASYLLNKKSLPSAHYETVVRDERHSFVVPPSFVLFFAKENLSRYKT